MFAHHTNEGEKEENKKIRGTALKVKLPPLPKAPEQNPPEGIPELESLISRMQDKANTIKAYVACLDVKINKGRDVDLDSYKRSMYAYKRTNKSVAALQLILKNRKQATREYRKVSLPVCFVRCAKQVLKGDVYKDIYIKAKDMQVSINKN